MRNEILSEVANLILQGRFSMARKRFVDSPLSDQMPDVEKILAKLSNIDEVVEKSFVNQTGKTIKIETSKGVQTVKIAAVKDGILYVREKLGSGFIKRKIPLKRLSSSEKRRRMDSMSEVALAIYDGARAAHARKHTIAAKLFSKVEPLSEPLAHALATANKVKAEETAIREMRRLFRKWAPPENPYPTAKQVPNRLDTRVFDKREFEQLKESVTSYRQTFGELTYAKENDEALTALIEGGKALLLRKFKIPYVVKDIDMELVPIKPGSFTMGAKKDDHKATLTKPFFMGKFEVTQKQYEKIMGNNPSIFKRSGENAPVDNLLWRDAVSFCEALTQRESNRLPDGYVFRLPTETEWEYCCRAGTDTMFFFGDDAKKLDDYGWYDANSGKKTHPVGQKKPNDWGLYDTLGNVSEWCHDWFRNPTNEAVVDPTGPADGVSKVCRGGQWSYPAEWCRCSFRVGCKLTFISCDTGFRVILGPVIK